MATLLREPQVCVAAFRPAFLKFHVLFSASFSLVLSSELCLLIQRICSYYGRQPLFRVIAFFSLSHCCVVILLWVFVYLRITGSDFNSSLGALGWR